MSDISLQIVQEFFELHQFRLMTAWGTDGEGAARLMQAHISGSYKFFRRELL